MASGEEKYVQIYFNSSYPYLFSVDGQWGPFGSWSTCSQTCGGGVRTRQRSCDSPPPSNGGADCVGRATRERNCNTNACPGENARKILCDF